MTRAFLTKVNLYICMARAICDRSRLICMYGESRLRRKSIYIYVWPEPFATEVDLYVCMARAVSDESRIIYMYGRIRLRRKSTYMYVWREPVRRKSIYIYGESLY